MNRQVNLNIVNAKQLHKVPDDLKHEILTIPANITPSFGTHFTIDFREPNCMIHSLYIEFICSALTGVVRDGNFPNLNPVSSWFNRIVISQGGIENDTIYPESNNIINQLYYSDEARRTSNLLGGDYKDASHRAKLNQIANQSYILDLNTYFDQGNVPILTQNHALKLTVHMNTFSYIYNTSVAVTGSPVFQITGCNLLARVTKLSPQQVKGRMDWLLEKPLHYKFQETRYTNYQIQSGVNQCNLILNGFSGKIPIIYFIFRKTGFTGIDFYKHLEIKDFQILSSTGESLIGGIPIPSRRNLLLDALHWTKSTYLSEFDSNLSDSYVYSYSFSADPSLMISSGGNYTSYHFKGNEQLRINFKTTLTDPYSCDVYALVDATLEQTLTSVKKLKE